MGVIRHGYFDGQSGSVVKATGGSCDIISGGVTCRTSLRDADAARDRRF